MAFRGWAIWQSACRCWTLEKHSGAAPPTTLAMYSCTRLLRAPVATQSLGPLLSTVPQKFHGVSLSNNSLLPSVGRLSCVPPRLASVPQRVSVRAMAQSAGHDLEAFGKAKSGTGSPSKERGDCPFSQRIYLELEEKGLPYTATYIEEGPDKPSWFMEKNPAGLMPVLRHGQLWLQDSDKIAQYLEEKFPEPSLRTPDEFKQVGAGLFPAFTNWLKAKNPEDPAKEEYLKELRALNEHLDKHGPYIAGVRPTDSDFALAPKLRHARVALSHFYGFQIPLELRAVHNFIQTIESRPSFKKTDSPDEMIVQGWQKKFELPDRMAQPARA